MANPDETRVDFEQRFARFMENLPGLAWIKDGQGRYIYANEVAVRTFRVTHDQLYGKTDEEVFPPETAAKFRENDRRALRGETGLQIVEALLHEDGVVHHSYVSKFPIPGKDGTSPLIGGIAIDITDQMRAEAALRLREQEAGRQKDAFLAALGHELRNPLAPMVTALQLLRLRGVEGREVEILEHQIGHMRRLVDDLLDVARITSGKIQLRMEEVDLASIVARAIDTVAPVLEQHRQILQVNVATGVFGVRADPVRLTQVVTNLLDNATKYSDEGSTITVSAALDGDMVRLSIRDEGIGIAPAILDTVFDSFVQHQDTMHRSRGGLGLGLAIVKSLVQQHGGEVFVTSEGIGKGSEFTVLLPVVAIPEDVRAAVMPPAGRSPTGEGRERILVVDDNRDAAETIRDALVSHGYVVAMTSDSASALGVARDFRPDIALLDIGMPIMDGYKLAARLRQLDDFAAVRLVAVTGFGQPGDRERALAAGFDRHLVKPVDLKSLIHVIEELRTEMKAS
jgi:PAS domain S-box-containing protein